MKMFPNLRAEMARGRITMRMMQELLEKHGVKISLSQLSQKMNGKYEFTLEEAEAIQAVLNSGLSLEVLFNREAAV
jgi:hypothetical protein